MARDVVRLAASGLQRSAPQEVAHLDVLGRQVVEEGISPADVLLRQWHGAWAGSAARLVDHLRIA
jgi:gamma-glutamylcysteine synthetase